MLQSVSMCHSSIGLIIHNGIKAFHIQVKPPERDNNHGMHPFSPPNRGCEQENANATIYRSIKSFSEPKKQQMSCLQIKPMICLGSIASKLQLRYACIEVPHVNENEKGDALLLLSIVMF